MQAQFTPQQVSAEAPQHEMSIRDGRFASPLVITHGPWISASRLWPHLQAATGRQARNAPAAGPKAMDIDHRERQGQVRNLSLGRQRWFVFLGETHVCRGPTDVNRDAAGKTRLT